MVHKEMARGDGWRDLERVMNFRQVIDWTDHVLESTVDDFGPVFGTELSGRCCETFDIAKKHGDNTMLAFHRTTAAGGLELGRQFSRDEGLLDLAY